MHSTENTEKEQNDNYQENIFAFFNPRYIQKSF